MVMRTAVWMLVLPALTAALVGWAGRPVGPTDVVLMAMSFLIVQLCVVARSRRRAAQAKHRLAESRSHRREQRLAGPTR